MSLLFRLFAGAVGIAAAVLCFSPALAFGAGASGGVTVSAGPPLTAPPPGVSKHADALSFFPRNVTVHVGETVTWQFFGFHTVTFPGTKRPYPFAVPTGKQPRIEDAAGQPFWWSGKAPLLVLSPLALLPQGGSTVSSPSETVSSGLMRILSAPANQPPAPYSLTFTKPGVYHYQCAVHPTMHGSVIVLPSTTGGPSAASEAAAAQALLQKTIADVKKLQVLAKPKAKHTVFVGYGHAATGAEVTAFSPGRLDVNVGDSVTFVNHDQTDIHTVTFGPPKFTGKLENNFVAPHGKQLRLSGLGAFPSEPPGAPVQYNGTNHGNGFLGSGILEPQGAPPSAGPKSFTVTFTKPGTYHYECLIHQNMDGTIVVH